MIQEHDYHLVMRGREGGTGELAALEGGLPPLEVGAPPEFGGTGGSWSPEHLFVASVSACLMTTFREIASNSKMDYLEYSDEPSGHMERDESGLYRMSTVTLRPRVVVADSEKTQKAYRLVEKAERACLISRSIQAEVRMEPTVEVADQADSARTR